MVKETLDEHLWLLGNGGGGSPVVEEDIVGIAIRTPRDQRQLRKEGRTALLHRSFLA
jgi:hypothetical protein